MNKQKPIPVFWSGGWDSTFRILQLVLVKKIPVQPYYILDTERKSMLNELEAIKKIKVEIENNFPEESKNLLPTNFFALFSIEKNKVISDSHAAIQKKQRMGIQYEWLARFCAQQKISEMEISLELRTKAEDNIVINASGEFLIKVVKPQGMVFKISENAKGTAIFNVFGNMIFPVIDLTKSEMFTFAQNHGFSEILTKSWFCHTPTKNNSPCGKCQPCRSVVTEGLSWRLNKRAKIRYYIWPVLRKVAKTFQFNAI